MVNYFKIQNYAMKQTAIMSNCLHNA